uniref:Hypotheticial protein n=1 Tax=Schistosoma japonicum TaxID=6182 RepID=C7TXR0_SCHJA|nr:hypotheticial protein [Schistosoma japonicum]
MMADSFSCLHKNLVFCKWYCCSDICFCKTLCSITL